MDVFLLSMFQLFGVQVQATSNVRGRFTLADILLARVSLREGAIRVHIYAGPNVRHPRASEMEGYPGFLHFPILAR